MILSLYNNYVNYDNRVYVYNTRYMNAVSFDSSDIDEVKTFLQSSDELYFHKDGFCSCTG